MVEKCCLKLPISEQILLVVVVVVVEYLFLFL